VGPPSTKRERKKEIFLANKSSEKRVRGEKRGKREVLTTFFLKRVEKEYLGRCFDSAKIKKKGKKGQFFLFLAGRKGEGKGEGIYHHHLSSIKKGERENAQK